MKCELREFMTVVEMDIESRWSTYSRGCSTHTAGVYYCPEIDDLLYDLLGRRKLALKMYKRYDELHPTVQERYPNADWSSPETFARGHTNLLDATRIQNLYAWHGLAPRVFSLVYSPKEDRWGQVVTFVPDTKVEQPPSKAAITSVDGQYGIISKYNNPFLRTHIGTWAVGDQIVDFGPTTFDGRQYLASLIKSINENRPTQSYQAIPELAISGNRDTQDRAETLHFDSIDFSGKSVLDLGCNMGSFCLEAVRRGAKRVVGIDAWFDRAHLSYQIANWLGYWNIDYLNLELPQDRRHICSSSDFYGRFDIVLCLSTAGHIGGYDEWMGLICGEVMVLEGHNNETRGKYQAPLQRDFDRVEFIGFSRDWKERVRPVFMCWKEKQNGQ